MRAASIPIRAESLKTPELTLRSHRSPFMFGFAPPLRFALPSPTAAPSKFAG